MPIIDFVHLSLKDMFQCLFNLIINKAVGIYGKSSKVLKHRVGAITPIIHRLTLCINTCSLPN